MESSKSLSQRDREILALEEKTWKYPGSKERAIYGSFGMSPTRYYQVLNKLLDSDEALAHAPLVVNRLRQVRTARASQRSKRRL